LSCHLVSSDEDGDVHLALTLHVVDFVMSCHVLSCHLLTLDKDGDVHFALTLRVVHFVMSCLLMSCHVTCGLWMKTAMSILP
jgi:hypothetical protein